jgi:hypothetical protein
LWGCFCFWVFCFCGGSSGMQPGLY